MAISKAQLRSAKQRTQAFELHVPKAVSAQFDARQRLLFIELESRAILCFRDVDLQGLAGADGRDLREIEISPSGYGIHFPAIDQDFYLPALIEGFVGTRSWMAERGRKGGQSTSDAKKAASRSNGRLGGRPRKGVEGVAASSR
jgi:hypothetical protein